MTSSHAELLTVEDFQQLQQNPLPESRASIASKIGSHLERAEKETIEYQIACEIAFYLQKDNEHTVRIALTESIHQSEAAPKQLVLLLAMDEEDAVALPILKISPVIQDDDLIDILPKIDQTDRLVAVAERKFLSVTVTSMLAERNIEQIAITLLNNDSAIIDDEVILQIAYKHSASKPVLSRMMKRMPLPAAAVNHMVKMQQSSNQENRAPSEIRSFTSLEREELKNDVLSLMFLGQKPSIEACEAMIEQLEKKEKVSAAFIILALCLGHKQLFAAHMVRNTGLPYDRIESLCNVGEQEFSLLMNKSGVSPSLYQLIYHAYQGMMQQLALGTEEGSREFAAAMTQCLIEAESKGVNFATTIGKPLAKALKATFG